jgi:triosephosphate isomerase (TIM)
MRKRIVAGNWKMNTSIAQGETLALEVVNGSKSIPSQVQLIVIPPYTHLISVAGVTSNSKVSLGGQNCAAWDKGAYTGEVSVSMIAETGAKYVVIGHSERREYFVESNETLLKKVQLVLGAKLTPIFCCGEKLDERDSNRHFEVVEKQLAEVLFHITETEMASTIIAYEPVWAIGTGRTASPEQAQEMHSFIRLQLAKKFGTQVANGVSILYGGSCKPDNAKEIFSKPDVDGGLIGGASLVAADFIAIAKSFPQ